LSAREPAAVARTSEGVVHVLPFARDDAALVAALKARQSGTPAMLVDRYGGYVERLLARVVGVDSELPDLIQDVFVQAISNLNDLRDPSAVKPWLGSLAINTAHTWIRRRRLRRRWVRFESPSDVPEMKAAVAGPEVNQTLKRTYEILETLPPDERIAFALRFIDGAELTTTAELCSVSLATIKRRLARAEKSFLEAARHDPLLKERVEASPRWRDK
jgi:RNA polymerase sigma-70 factor, ECF subfamily